MIEGEKSVIIPAMC